MSSPTLAQKLTAEVIGTAILVFLGAGSVALTGFLNGTNPFTMAELNTINFAFAFAVIAAVYSIGHVSGCHINPAVTIALAATKKVDWRTALAYIGAQIAGAVIGSILIAVVLVGNDPAKLGLGAVSYNPETTGILGAIVAEMIGTAILVFVVFGSAVDGRAPSGFAGLVIGFAVYAIIVVVGPVTGSAINPAREIGPDIVQAIIGGSTKWEQLPVYIVGPIAGGLIGAFLYEYVGHHQTATVPGPAIAEAAHADA